ncbi:MAG: aminotransferase class I/II-fold pyridoxal phosphate-dependent enzyme [Planctomycetaceae bacterium]|nr:aminotransferase class I/II-fold pyridoxal phosphate-dependent enzyme [Planctomycetaceae bacterium]
MRWAMLTAEVGDDMLGEDPTVNQLEARIAEMCGKQAAVFVCSGTQANQVAVRVHCRPGDELLINETGHIANFEAGGAAALSGVTVRTIQAEQGRLDVDQLKGRIRSNDQHYGRTKLVCLENTTNLGGGVSYSLPHLRRVSEWARSHGLRLHLDGARVFNAVVSQGYALADVCECFDTISICFSKGLGCPMGSVVVGSHDDIFESRRVRKLFGGAMRQAGFAAAAALYALDHNIHRLTDDHENAKTLGHLLQQIPGMTVETETLETNLVYFSVDPSFGSAVQMVAALQKAGVLLFPMGGQRMRAVTHLNVSAEDMHRTADILRQCLADGISDQPLTTSGPYEK